MARGDSTMCMFCYVTEVCILGIDCYAFKTYDLSGIIELSIVI